MDEYFELISASVGKNILDQVGELTSETNLSHASSSRSRFISGKKLTRKVEIQILLVSITMSRLQVANSQRIPVS